jgi:cell wall-associated NlpC family hydrolase
VSPAPKKQSAVEKLQASTLRPTQLELMGDDVDLTDLYLSLNHKDLDIRAAVQDVIGDLTIQGASTVTVTVTDRDRVLLRSGRLSQRNDIEIDGLFFRLTSVDKSGDTLTLAFEDREVSILRTYNKPIKQSLSTSRHKVTRAAFILRMITEVKETKIKYIIPELSKIQPIGKLPQLPTDASKAANRSYGIPKNNALTVKGTKMDDEQRKNANAILDTGVSQLVPLNATLVRKMLVMSIMCVIQESTLRNLRGGDRDSVGLFQQRGSMGWPASRDIPVDSAAFFAALRKVVTAQPDIQYYAAVQAVQRSGFPTAYAQWRTEAERIVTAYGEPGGDVGAANNQASSSLLATQADYEFYRGVPPTTKKAGWGKESSWDAIQRLANEVQFRAFFVSGTFYYVSDDDLLKSQPVAVLDESSQGVDSIDGTYAEGTKSASITLVCECSRWVAPPGSVIQLKNMGPWDGRWLVNDINRSMFSRQATITLKKRTPILPEPAASNLASETGGTPVPATYSGTPVGPPTVPDPTSAAGKAVLAAESQLGLPYRWGAELEDVSFDCSGLMQFAYGKAGLSIPRVAQAQYDYGILVMDGSLKEGDLLFFGANSRSIEHVGMYVGDDTMIQAPHTGAFVELVKNGAWRSWTDPRYIGATRPTAKGR